MLPASQEYYMLEHHQMDPQRFLTPFLSTKQTHTKITLSHLI